MDNGELARMINTRVDRLETKIDQVCDRVDAKIDNLLNNRLEAAKSCEETFQKHDSRLDKVEKSVAVFDDRHKQQEASTTRRFAVWGGIISILNVILAFLLQKVK